MKIIINRKKTKKRTLRERKRKRLQENKESGYSQFDEPRGGWDIYRSMYDSTEPEMRTGNPNVWDGHRDPSESWINPDYSFYAGEVESAEGDEIEDYPPGAEGREMMLQDLTSEPRGEHAAMIGTAGGKGGRKLRQKWKSEVESDFGDKRTTEFKKKREKTKKQQAVNMLLYRIKQGYNETGPQKADAEAAFKQLKYMRKSGDPMVIEAYKELLRQQRANIMEGPKTPSQTPSPLDDFAAGNQNRPAAKQPKKSASMSASEKAWDKQKAKQDAGDARKQYDDFTSKLASGAFTSQSPQAPVGTGGESGSGQTTSQRRVARNTKAARDVEVDPPGRGMRHTKPGTDQSGGPEREMVPPETTASLPGKAKTTELVGVGPGGQRGTEATNTSKSRLASARKAWKEARTAMGPNWKSLKRDSGVRVAARTAYRKLQAAKKAAGKGRPSKRSKPETSAPSDRFDKGRRRSTSAFPTGGSGELPAGDYSVASEKGKEAKKASAKKALAHPAVTSRPELAKLIQDLLD